MTNNTKGIIDRTRQALADGDTTRLIANLAAVQSPAYHLASRRTVRKVQRLCAKGGIK